METAPFSFDFVAQGDQLETDAMPPAGLKFVREAKLKTLTALHRQWCFDHIKTIPAPGVSYHMVTNARFDFWDFVPTILKMASPAVIEEFYASNWILNRRNAVELLELFDQGKIRRIGFLAGSRPRSRRCMRDCPPAASASGPVKTIQNSSPLFLATGRPLYAKALQT